MRNESPFLCKAITPTIIPFKPFPVKFPETYLSPLSLSCSSTVKKNTGKFLFVQCIGLLLLFPSIHIESIKPFSSCAIFSWLQWQQLALLDFFCLCIYFLKIHCLIWLLSKVLSLSVFFFYSTLVLSKCYSFFNV